MIYYTAKVVCRSSGLIKKVKCYSKNCDGEVVVVPLGCDTHNGSHDCYRCRVDVGRSIMEELELKVSKEEGEFLHN